MPATSAGMTRQMLRRLVFIQAPDVSRALIAPFLHDTHKLLSQFMK
jgi:hypothetical protein